MIDRLSKKVVKREMNIKPQDKTIKELLLSGRQFIIPRFQREYSWDRKNYKEFLDDMLNCLIISEGKVNYDQYFLGTMLFVGDCFEGDKNEIDVVDGQQRLTTITILFSALSDRFIQINQNTLSEQIFKYIMTTNDDGEVVRIIQSKTHYPFFSFYIQEREKTNIENPSTEEEQCIKETYEYLYNSLSEDKLKGFLKKKYGDDNVDELNYIDILKAVRDQVLNTAFVSISTKERKQANMIFEILNAKGKNLSGVDLIKNKIFEIVNDTEPADYAEEKWKSIKSLLNDRNIDVGFVQFYRYFWISKYKKSSVNKLYDDFKSTIKPVSKKRYKEFLAEIEDTARIYVKTVSPQRNDFQNKKEYFGLIQSIKVLSDDFNIVQVRIALIALLEAKEKGIITLKQLKSIVYELENFHFSYNAICSKPTNRLEKIYSSFSINLRKCSDKVEAREILKDLINQLNALYVSYQEFESEFIKLSYSKHDTITNIKARYAINKIATYFEESELFRDEGSIEHILPESEGGNNNNIGNLILLEQTLNEEADCLSYSDKINVYNRSSYRWVQDFISENSQWDNTMILPRAKKLAIFYYKNILNKLISSDDM